MTSESSSSGTPTQRYYWLDDADDEITNEYDGWDNEVYQLSGEVYWINAVASQASYESWYVCATTWLEDRGLVTNDE